MVPAMANQVGRNGGADSQVEDVRDGGPACERRGLPRCCAPARREPYGPALPATNLRAMR
jgi:hypothetical protein